MKIIDFEKRGNVVRFYLGADDCEDYWGDDWDDTPYEHNAGRVYDEFVTGTRDIAFPVDYVVLEPKEDNHFRYNSPFCKDNFKGREAPCIVAMKIPEDQWAFNDDFMNVSMNDKAVRFYYGDPMEPGPMTIWGQ